MAKKEFIPIERGKYATIDEAIVGTVADYSRKSSWRLGMLQNDLFKSMRVLGYNQKDIIEALERLVNDPDNWNAELRNAEVNKRYKALKQDPVVTKEQIKQFAEENFVQVLSIGNEDDSDVYMEKWATNRYTKEKFQAPWATRYWFVGKKYRTGKPEKKKTNQP